MALGYMRRHKKWLYVFLWLVIAAFIVLYIPALSPRAPAGSPGEVMVTVGDQEITVGEFQRDYRRQLDFYNRLYQGRMDDATLRQMGLPNQVLQGLITDRIVDLEADRLGIQVSDEAVARAIATAPEWQDNGEFVGTEEIRRRLDLAGMSEQDYEASLRRQLKRQTLQHLVTDGVLVTDAEAQREYRSRNEQVKLEYALVEAESFREEIEVTDADVAARFEEKKESYRLPERRVVRYVLLDREVLRPLVTVTDRDIEQYYQDHRDEFLQEEEACAHHILIKVRSGDSGEGHPEDDARRIAQTLLDRIRAGASFEELARASSEDEGSAANGGDLGCFPAGRMVRQFDDAVFALEPGQVSDLVRTSFGYHIIRLDSLKEETTLPLAQVKERIRAMVTEQKMTERGDEISQALSAALVSGKTLEEAAAAQGLAVKTSPPFAKGDPPPALASPTLAARVFEMKPGDVEKEGFALPQGAVFIALAEVQPTRLPELDEVKDRVRRDLVEEGAFVKAHDVAEKVRARAEQVGLERAAEAFKVVRKETPSLTPRGQALGDLGRSLALSEVAFSLPEGQLSEPVRAPGSAAPEQASEGLDGGWAILRVLERKGFDETAFKAEEPRLVASLQQQKQAQAFQAYIAAAQDRYAVKRRNDAYRRALGEER
jgi:peptidyl-prolyl cis-trans isomerase D